MEKRKIEFSESTMGEINALIDRIDASCAYAVTGGNERQRILECQDTVFRLRDLIKNHGIITTYRCDCGKRNDAAA